MPNLIRYEGIILQRDGQLANSLACCCDKPCDCCEVKDTIQVQGIFTYTGNFGVTGGTIVAYEKADTLCEEASYAAPVASTGYGRKCSGKINFEVYLNNGACQEDETVSGYACLYIIESADNGNKGNCCYWEVWVEEPYIECLRDGFPDWETVQPAVVPTCTGGDVPADCQFIQPIDACYGFCSLNRQGCDDTNGCEWDAITFITDAPGRCNCDTYYLDTSGGTGGGGSSPPDGGGGSSPP